MNRFLIWLLFVTLQSLVLPIPLQAQHEIAAKAIRDVKEGILVVRLVSHHKKIAELSRLSESNTLSGPAQLRVRDNLKQVIAERDAENARWMTHFQNAYHFSEVRFVFDTTKRVSLLDQKGAGCFLDENFKIDPTLEIGDQPFLMAYFGTTNRQTGTGTEAVIFRNSNFEELGPPFPYYVKLVSFRYVFNKIFAPSTAEDKNIKSVVEKINQRFQKYWESSSQT